jgi:circadian clock protein KaiB
MQHTKAERGVKTVLRLYVAGISVRSTRAIQDARRICDSSPGNCELTVVDVLQQPELAHADQIVAVPTLVKSQPSPARRYVGDISNLAIPTGRDPEVR